jgi:hypothetical protein
MEHSKMLRFARPPVGGLSHLSEGLSVPVIEVARMLPKPVILISGRGRHKGGGKEDWDGNSTH